MSNQIELMKSTASNLSRVEGEVGIFMKMEKCWTRTVDFKQCARLLLYCSRKYSFDEEELVTGNICCFKYAHVVSSANVERNVSNV